MENRVVIYKSRRKAVIIVCASLLLALAGWLFLQYTDTRIAGWSFIILASLCMIFGMGSWFDKKAYIILTAEGITEMSGSLEEIEWDAIRHVEEFYYRGQSFIRLLLDRNYKSAMIQPTWFYRFDRLYAQEGVKAVFIRISFLQVNSIKLFHFINKMVQTNAENRSALLNDFRSSLKEDL